MDAKLNKILDTYVVENAGDAFLESVMSRLFLENVLARLQERKSVSRRRSAAGAALFAVLLLCGFWMGNETVRVTAFPAQTYKSYVAEAVFGFRDINNILL
jgi:hypothetical protein